MSILENSPLCPVNVYATVYSMWDDEDIEDAEAACCANCGDRLPGDTDVVVDGRRWCSDCGYKVGVTGDDEATIAVPYETMNALVFGGGA